MKKETIDITKDLEEWFVKEVLPKLTEEQMQEILDHPEIISESVIEAYKRFCERKGIDYETTAMYQEEMKYRRQNGEKE